MGWTLVCNFYGLTVVVCRYYNKGPESIDLFSLIIE